MRRIERLINLIAALLEARTPMSADDIRSQIAGYDQENFESFRRAFERDKEALRAMGIPIEVRHADLFGAVEGYTIPKERYYLPELDLEPDELAALRLAANAILGAGDAAQAGLMKLSLEADVSGPGAPGIAWGADLAAQQPLLAPLYGAVTERRPVSFSYARPGASEAQRRDVEPYGLVHRRGHWYLVGRDRGRDAMRVFKVSRMSEPVQLIPGSYSIPEGFDAAEIVGGEAWEGRGDGTTHASVRFAPSFRWWAEQNLTGAERREEPDGSLLVEWPVANLDALISWVVSFGPEVEILAPPEARTRLLSHLGPWLEDAR